MRVLVTGGAGFIGSHIVEELLRNGCAVAIVDDFSSGRRENLPRGVTVIEQDIRNRTALGRVFALERPEVVIHLAAQINVRKSLVDPFLDADANIIGSLSLFQVAISSGVRRIVYASSGGAVYGDQPGCPFRESDLPRPSSPYGISKLSGEHYGRHLAEAAGREFVALRLANVYGPRQDPRGEAGVVALFLSEMLSGRPPIIFGDGSQTRDFIWVGDVVEAFMKAFDGPSGVYNVGTGQETRVVDLCEQLRRAVGFSHGVKWAGGIFGEVRRNALSVNLARDVLGWQVRTSLSNGLLATADYFKGRIESKPYTVPVTPSEVVFEGPYSPSKE